MGEPLRSGPNLAAGRTPPTMLSVHRQEEAARIDRVPSLLRRPNGIYAPMVAELHRFRVLWGQMGRPGFMTEVVEAWDPEDALAVAAEIHPELHRPRVAVPASEAWPRGLDS